MYTPSHTDTRIALDLTHFHISLIQLPPEYPALITRRATNLGPSRTCMHTHTCTRRLSLSLPVARISPCTHLHWLITHTSLLSLTLPLTLIHSHADADADAHMCTFAHAYSRTHSLTLTYIAYSDCHVAHVALSLTASRYSDCHFAPTLLSLTHTHTHCIVLQ